MLLMFFKEKEKTTQKNRLQMSLDKIQKMAKEAAK